MTVAGPDGDRGLDSADEIRVVIDQRSRLFLPYLVGWHRRPAAQIVRRAEIRLEEAAP